MSGRLKAVVGLGVTVGLLWWVLRDVSFAEVVAEVREADPWFMAAAVVAATFNFVLRALRWRVLLEPAHAGSTLDQRFGATAAGIAANNLFPARVGELVRAFVLSRVAAFPLGACVGSLVIERVLDGLVLVSLLLMPLLLPSFPAGDPETAAFVRRAAILGSVIFAGGFLGMWLAARRPEAAVRAWEATLGRLVPERFGPRVSHLVRTFVEGLGAVRRLGVMFRAVGWTYLVWLTVGASIWFGMLAFDITEPGFAGSLFVHSVMAFAVAVPSTPGYVGVFEWGARVGLAPWDIPPETIVSFATSYHILTFIPITLIGLWYLRKFGLKWSDVSSRARAEGREGSDRSAE